MSIFGKGSKQDPDLSILPDAFKYQVVYLIVEFFDFGEYGTGHGGASMRTIEKLVYNFNRERGVLDNEDDSWLRLQKYIHQLPPKESLVLIEQTFARMEELYFKSYTADSGARYVCMWPDPAHFVSELNRFFKKHQLPYAYVGGKIVDRSNDYTHTQLVAQTTNLLVASKFKGAADEFSEALVCYREDRFKDACNYALKAVESTIKSIAIARKWSYDPHAPASKLFALLFEQGLVPLDLASHFNGLRSTLESGLPTVRNRRAGHGQGAEVVEMPSYVAEYAVNLAAAHILFLIASHEEN